MLLWLFLTSIKFVGKANPTILATFLKRPSTGLPSSFLYPTPPQACNMSSVTWATLVAALILTWKHQWWNWPRLDTKNERMFLWFIVKVKPTDHSETGHNCNVFRNKFKLWERSSEGSWWWCTLTYDVIRTRSNPVWPLHLVKMIFAFDWFGKGVRFLQPIVDDSTYIGTIIGSW